MKTRVVIEDPMRESRCRLHDPSAPPKLGGGMHFWSRSLTRNSVMSSHMECQTQNLVIGFECDSEF